MRPVFFKAFGALTLLLNFFRAFLISENPWYTQTSMMRFRESILFVVVAIVGLGLIFLRRWAALYFSIPLFWYGINFFLSSIEGVSFPYNLLAMCGGVSLMLPLVITIRTWRQLRWGGDWFV